MWLGSSLPDKPGIYSIVNKVNDKVYVGQTVCFQRRLREHKSRLELNKHKNKHLQFAFNKYGLENFEFKILEIVDDKQKLDDREKFWFDKLKCYDKEFGYNYKEYIPGYRQNRKVSQHTRQTLREKHAGRVCKGGNELGYNNAQSKYYTIINSLTSDKFVMKGLAKFCLDFGLSKMLAYRIAREELTWKHKGFIIRNALFCEIVKFESVRENEQYINIH